MAHPDRDPRSLIDALNLTAGLGLLSWLTRPVTKHQAFHDAPTGLPNRLLFQDRISRQVASARRDGGTVGVLFVDLDDFKVVNDTMGHGVGDELLAAVGMRLSGLIGDCDTAAVRQGRPPGRPEYAARRTG